MRITFTLARKAIWRYQYQRWLPGAARRILRLCALPVLFAYASYYGGLGLLFSEIVAAVVGIVPLAAFILVIIDLLRKMSSVKAAATGERIAEIGKFDFRWGRAGSSGYYYHWAYLEKVREDREYLCFVLPRERGLLVPKSAFATPEESQKFLALALARWETAKANQRYAASDAGEGVWPPPPQRMK